MSRDSIRGFAAGLLFAAIIIGSYYYLIEDQQQDWTFEELKQASKEKGFELVDKNTMSKENIQQEETSNASAKEEPETTATSQPETFQFQITTGMGSDDIARLLFENNIIENTDQFEIYMKDNDLTKNIQIGTYQINKGMSVEEISNTITN